MSKTMMREQEHEYAILTLERRDQDLSDEDLTDDVV